MDLSKFTLVVSSTDFAWRDKTGFWQAASLTVDGAVQFSSKLQDSSSRIKAPFQFTDTSTWIKAYFVPDVQVYQLDNWNWCACGEISDVIWLVRRRKELSLIWYLECHLYTNKWCSKNLEKQMKPSFSNMQEPPKLQEQVRAQDSQTKRDSQIPERSREIIVECRAGMCKLCGCAWLKSSQCWLLYFRGEEGIHCKN